MIFLPGGKMVSVKLRWSMAVLCCFVLFCAVLCRLCCGSVHELCRGYIRGCRPGAAASRCIMQRGRDLTLRGVLRLETASFASHLKFNSLILHLQICHSETFSCFFSAVFQRNSRDVFREARGSVARGHSGSRTLEAPPETFQEAHSAHRGRNTPTLWASQH